MISIVVPAYNEEAVLPEFHARLSRVLHMLGIDAEVLYVNDGSSDGTLTVLERIRDDDPRVGILDLSRNFGKEIAITAGMDHARGDAVILIDADLQDPPEIIPDLVTAWKEGFDIVYAKRTSRDGESWLKKATAHGFYRFIRTLSRINIPEDTGDFRLLNRRAVTSLGLLREQHRFMKGLFAWIGFKQRGVTYHRDRRFAGATKWNYWRLWNFAITGITSFSTGPLKVATYLGLSVGGFAFAYAALIIYKTLVYGESVRGYPSLMVAVLFLGGVQLIAIGLVGEYVGRMFDETKRRPLYLLNAFDAPQASNTAPVEATSVAKQDAD